MDKRIRAILLILLVIIVPFLIYAYLQIRSLNEDEKMADTIYSKQMETVLFSLNQYADDRMNQWVSRLSNKEYSIYKNASDLVLGNESIQLLVLHQIYTKKDTLCFNDYVAGGDKTPIQIETWYEANDSLINKLTDYYKAGFQKIQPAINLKTIDGLKTPQAGITVMLYDKDSILYNALFIFEENYWIEQVLGSKMQEIAQDEFSVSVVQKTEETHQTSLLYSTNTLDVDKEYTERALWILPNTYLTIQPNGISYSELIKDRNYTNLYFLFFSILTVLIGALLIFRNTRNALKIAQLKSDFVSNVSHEIRTPLSLIRMYAETLMLGRLPSEEKKQHYYQIIHHESGRLTYLVNNILDFSRIEANRKTYQMTEMNMNNLVQQLYENYTYSFNEKNIKCVLTLAETEIPVKVDVQAFEEALSNLIDNAIKYSDENKTIFITTRIKDGYGHCQVADQGIGIASEHLNKIFDKFYRVEDALTQKTKGTGLGLSLVKHIMDAHGGEVLVTSKPGQGSTFTLKFPLSDTTI